MTVTPTSGLSMDEVANLVSEGEAHKAGDEQRRELADLRNSAETLLYTTEQAFDGYADLVEEDTLNRARQCAATLREKLTNQGSLEEVRAAYQKLEGLTFAIAEALYGEPPPEEPAP